MVGFCHENACRTLSSCAIKGLEGAEKCWLDVSVRSRSSWICLGTRCGEVLLFSHSSWYRLGERSLSALVLVWIRKRHTLALYSRGRPARRRFFSSGDEISSPSTRPDRSWAQRASRGPSLSLWVSRLWDRTSRAWILVRSFRSSTL